MAEAIDSNNINTEDLDLWGHDNELVESMYQRDGVLVKDYGNSDICYIFFASNDLFYPNTKEVFMKRIVEQNRFEWTRMAASKNITGVSGRHIFVRDIYKMWYVTGCDAKHSDMDSMLEYLRELSRGYRVVTIGSSAGGFMAMLAAVELGAICCFDFSGQMSQKHVMQDFYKWKLGNDIEDSPYYDLVKLLDKSDCKFYYFYPEYNEKDKAIYMEISDKDNVYGFSFGQKNHAATMMTSNIRYIVHRDMEYMDKLYKRYTGKVINIAEFFFRTVPLHMWIPLGYRETRDFINRRMGKS